MRTPELATKRAIVESKLRLYGNTIYDHEIELRVMERAKDVEQSKKIKEQLVKLEHIVVELETILKEIDAAIRADSTSPAPQ